MANERSTGASSGSRAPISEDELRRDETAWLARLHRDAADVAATLAERSVQVGDLVAAFGQDRCRAARLELQRFTNLSIKLLRPQFADLKGTP